MRREGWSCAPGAAPTSWEPGVTCVPWARMEGTGPLTRAGHHPCCSNAQTTCSSPEDFCGREAWRTRSSGSQGDAVPLSSPHHTGQVPHSICPQRPFQADFCRRKQPSDTSSDAPVRVMGGGGGGTASRNVPIMPRSSQAHSVLGDGSHIAMCPEPSAILDALCPHSTWPLTALLAAPSSRSCGSGKRPPPAESWDRMKLPGEKLQGKVSGSTSRRCWKVILSGLLPGRRGEEGLSAKSQDSWHTGPVPAPDRHRKTPNVACTIFTHPPPQSGPQGPPRARGLGPSAEGATAAQTGQPLQPWAGSPQACLAVGTDAFHPHSETGDLLGDAASEWAESDMQLQEDRRQCSLLGQAGREKQGGGRLRL